jgi:hypothetical protein
VTYYFQADNFFNNAGSGLNALNLKQASPPPNDDFNNATVVASLPFTAAVDITGATPAADDPTACGNSLADASTEWFRFTAPAVETLKVDIHSNSYLGVFTGTRGALANVACRQDPDSWVRFTAQPGVSYYIMVGLPVTYPMSVTLSVERITPPANDDFSNATLVASLPFSATTDSTWATQAADDPWGCGANQTVWYRFTPSTDMRVDVDTSASSYQAPATVFVGSRGTLSQVGGCGWPNLRFEAQAGQTYYIMVGTWGSAGTLVLSLTQAPPPLAISVSVDPVGSVVPSKGVATVRGTVTCNRPVFVSLDGQLQQQIGRATVSGWLSAGVVCDGTTPAAWSSVVTSTPGTFIGGRAAALFVGGHANVTAAATAWDPATGDFATSSTQARITLRGSAP